MGSLVRVQLSPHEKSYPLRIGFFHVMNDIPVDDDEEEKYSYSFLPILNMRSGCAISAKIRGAVPGKTVVHRRRGSSGAFLGAPLH